MIVRPDARDELSPGALGEQSPLVEDPHTVAEAFRLLHVVRRVQDRQATRAELLHGVEDGIATLRVHADGRLVQDEQTRAMEESQADVQPALHPS